MSELTFQDPKKKFCEELQAAREAKGLEIARVSEKTKIALHYLERLESGEWEFLPHAYVRAFLRSYSQAIGLDVEETLRQFDEIVEEPPVPVPGGPSAEDRERLPERKVRKRREDEEEAPRTPPKFTLAGEDGEEEGMKIPSRRSRSSSPYLWVGIAAVLVVGLLAIYFWPQVAPEKEVEEIPFDQTYREQREKNPPEEVVAEDAEAETADESAPAAGQADQQPLELQQLVVEALDSCYVEVRLDGSDVPVISTILLPEGRRVFVADSTMRVVLGNAGGVRLEYNDRLLDPPGPPGRVVTVTLGPEGIRNVESGVVRPGSPERASAGELAEPAEAPAPTDTL